jgi:DNA-directed RNA polymerase specialized sigma24 family protein
MTLQLQQRKERLYEGKEILARMSEEEKVDLYNRLRYFTKVCFRRLNKDEIHEVVVEAMLAVSEDRWAYPLLDDMGNPKDISFYKFLAGVIRNKVSRYNESKRRKVEFDQHDQSQTSEDWLDSIQYKQARSRGYELSNPETDAIRKESCEHMSALVSGDELLSKIVQLTFAGLEPREIAEELNLTRLAVYNARKRLRRLLNPCPRKRRNNGKANQQQEQKTKKPLR